LAAAEYGALRGCLRADDELQLQPTAAGILRANGTGMLQITRSSPDAAGSKDNRNPNRGVASGADSKLSASTAVTWSRLKTLSLGLFLLDNP
jgi:hypothetical protein